MLKRPPQIIITMGAVLTTGIVGTLAFYLTPLHDINLVEPPMHDVGPNNIFAAMQSDPDQYLFIDVRNQSAYDVAHAEGSINIPIHDFYDDRFALPKRDKTIVLICGDAKLAGVAYGYLAHYGFRNLARIEGGLAAWEEAGLPVVR